MLLWGRLQGVPETWDYSPPLTILSSSPDRRTKAPSSPLTGHQYLHHKALPFQSSLSGSQQWQHEPSIPQILLSKTKLDAALVSGLREGVLTPSPFHVKIRELPLLPLCLLFPVSFQQLFKDAPHLPISSLELPSFTSTGNTCLH